MRCLNPIVGWRRRDRPGITLRYSEGDNRFSLKLPCGSCVACLLDRSRQHAVRCFHERSLHERGCFVTLTYDEEHVPHGGSLWKDDFRDFMRRLRLAYPVDRIRFMACGEYGERWGRPHYHALLFGVDFMADRRASGRSGGATLYRSAALEGVWPMGRHSIGGASFASAAYVAGYVNKKLGERALAGRLPEFRLASLKPGLGRGWIERNYREVYARDSVIIDGVETRPPRFYDLWLQAHQPVLWSSVKARRVAARLPEGEDPDDRSSRWEVMEEVLKAKLNRFKREVEA